MAPHDSDWVNPHGEPPLDRSMTWMTLYLGHLHTVAVVAILIMVMRGAGRPFERFLSDDLAIIDRVIWSTAIGTIIGGTVFFIFGHIAWNAWVLWPVLAGLATLGMRSFRSELGALQLSLQRCIRFPGSWLTLLAITLFSLSGLAALGGDIGHDGISYHLLGPVSWWESGTIQVLPEHSHTAFPAIIEMWFAVAHALGRIEASGVLGVFFLVQLLGLIWRFSRELGATSRTAALGIGIAAAMPVLASTSDDYFVDVPFAVFALLALRASVSRPSVQTVILSALFAGGCLGTKYTGVFIGAATGLMLTWSYLHGKIPWRQTLWHAGLFSLLMLAIGFPHYMSNILVFGTPIIPPPPFLSDLWPALGWPTEIVAAFHHRIQVEVGAGFGSGWLNWFLLPWHFTFYPDVFRGGHGTWATLALAPAGLWMLRRHPLAWRYLAWAVFLTLLWFLTQQNARFLVHVIALVTAMGTIAIPLMLHRAGKVVGILTYAVIFSSLIVGIVGFGIFRSDRIMSVLTPDGADHWRKTKVPYVETIDYINRTEGVKKVLLLSKWVPGVYLRKPYVKTVGHYGNRPFSDIATPDEALRQLPRWQATHVIDVVQDGWLIKSHDARFQLVYSSEHARLYLINTEAN